MFSGIPYRAAVPIIAACLFAGAAQAAGEKAAPGAHAPDDGFGAFAPMPTPGDVARTPLELIQTLGLGFPTIEEGRPRLRIEMAQTGDIIAATVIETGWADDSVSGVVYRLQIERRGDAWGFAGVGRLNICNRGEERYRAGPCP